MGLLVVGIDLLCSHHGSVVMEINSSPGLESIEKKTKVNIASKIIEYLAENATIAKKGTRIKY